MNTMTSINWARTKHEDGSRTHTGNRAGWTFVARTPKTGDVVLKANHSDGRQHTSHHPTTAMAKAAALDVLHPAEAMAWTRDRATGDYVASWDEHAFRAYRHHGELFYQSTSADQDVKIEGFPDARRLAVVELQRAYGVPGPDVAPTAVHASVTSLESALRAAGIRFTAKQLAVAALSLAEAVPAAR